MLRGGHLEAGLPWQPTDQVMLPRWKGIQDFVAPCRVAGSQTTSDFWWPLNSLQYHQTTLATALHIMMPFQYISIENASPAPPWAVMSMAAGAGGQEVEGEGGSMPLYPEDFGWWDASKTGVFYHGTSALHLPSIIANGLRRSFGAGAAALQDVFQTPVAGVYVTDKPHTAITYPQNYAAGRHHLYGSDVVAEAGTYPMRCVLRCVGNLEKLL